MGVWARKEESPNVCYVFGFLKCREALVDKSSLSKP
jgi:hypothetical protein